MFVPSRANTHTNCTSHECMHEHYLTSAIPSMVLVIEWKVYVTIFVILSMIGGEFPTPRYLLAWKIGRTHEWACEGHWVDLEDWEKVNKLLRDTLSNSIFTCYRSAQNTLNAQHTNSTHNNWWYFGNLSFCVQKIACFVLVFSCFFFFLRHMFYLVFFSSVFLSTSKQLNENQKMQTKCMHMDNGHYKFKQCALRWKNVQKQIY